MNILNLLHSATGLVVFPLIALGFCVAKRDFQYRAWIAALGLQLVLAFILLKVSWFQFLFQSLNQFVTTIEAAATAGTSFVFGYLGGAELPFEEVNVGASYIIGFRALPLIIVIGALTALLSYWRILPFIIRCFAQVFSRTLNIGGAVAFSGAANIFVGMTEAPLFIRNSIKKLSYSELFMVMTLGMSTVAGTVLVLMAMLIVPYDGQPTSSDAEVALDYHGPIDAIAQGGVNGMKMVINIMALLISFIALVYLCNILLGLLPQVAGQALSLERVLGWLMAPICWLMGIPWSEASTAGSMMGIKTVLNELLAFIYMSELPANALSQRSALILSYGLCGFANFGSLGILVGGLSTLAPERRQEIARLGLLSIVSGTLATCMTASVIGVVTAL